MRPRIRRARLVLAVASSLLLAASACSDDEGRAGQAGNVTAPPATVETTTTASAPQDQPSDEATEQAGTLAGTAWVLDQIVEPGREPVDARGGPVPAIISFSGTVVDVYDGVNTVGGGYSVDGDEVRLDLGTPSQFPYPQDDLPQYDLIADLAQLDRAAVEGSRLVLTLRDGTRLEFEQASNGATG